MINIPSSKKDTNCNFQYSVLVNNSRQKVWNYLTNVSRWREWDTELVHSELSEDFALGAKGILMPKKGPQLKFYISELTQNKSYTFVTKMPLGTLEIKRTLEERDHQIQFTDDIRYTGNLKQ